MNIEFAKKIEYLKAHKIMNGDDLKSVFTKYNEIIIYGAGVVGNIIIKKIIEYGLCENIICCAVKDGFWNPKEVMGIPVLELKWMPHFRESACFIVAVREAIQEEVYKELLQFGCKNIKGIDDGFGLKSEQDLDTLTIKTLREDIQQLTIKMNELQNQIAEQNEVSSTNTETFKEYENCNYGKEIVITATGPTLNYYSPIKDAIHIGMNYACNRKDIPFEYYFIQDGNRRVKWKEMLDNTIEQLDCTIFIGKYLHRSIWNGNEFPVQCRNDKHIKRYFVHPSLVENIYQNICFHPLMDFYSVVFPAIHFSLFTHPKRIYLVGCDVSDNGHFNLEEDSSIINQWNINRMKFGYAKVKEFAEQYYPDTEIISVNPIGLKGLFKDIYE